MVRDTISDYPGPCQTLWQPTALLVASMPPADPAVHIRRDSGSILLYLRWSGMAPRCMACSNRVNCRRGAGVICLCRDLASANSVSGR
ncbi:unnamed protein product [Symbiodinium natans]|uniref:Uncharacterized protein n=1 Tax=Symbiodinium natans TaxID=878477 RepID=A0A812TQH0_9DINO|nr:unnamed protein product [Symbiodinium natans]